MPLIDNIRDWFTAEPARNKNASILAGFLFFSGWWILIDAMSVDKSTPHQINTGQVFVGIFGTVSLFMVNTVKNSHINSNSEANGARIAKVWLLIGFIMGFAALIATVWIMIDDFINNPKKDGWQGVALLLQNLLILVGNLVYKFGRNEEVWNDS